MVNCSSELCKGMTSCRGKQASRPRPLPLASTFDQFHPNPEPDMTRRLINMTFGPGPCARFHFLALPLLLGTSSLDCHDFYDAFEATEIVDVAGVYR